MADRRPEVQDGARVKRLKTEDSDSKMNPYLAHMYEDQNNNDSGYSTGYSNGDGYGTGVKLGPHTGWGGGSVMANMPRHKTTADMARKAEEGPNNAFTGKPLSKQYFNILKTRRGLPVHAQRYSPVPDHAAIGD